MCLRQWVYSQPFKCYTAYLLPCLAALFLGDNVATWTLTDLSRGTEAQIFSELFRSEHLTTLLTAFILQDERALLTIPPPLPEREGSADRLSFRFGSSWESGGLL